MDAKSYELGPFEPVPDALVLAAVQRAQRHGGRPASRADVAAQLGFVHSAATSRRLRPQLESLTAASSLERVRKHGEDQWALTSKGTRCLAAARRAGRVSDLSESPQHRRWRHAREAASARYDAARTLLYETLEAAEDLAEPAAGPLSDKWFAMGARLEAAFSLMGSVTYCRDEWPEPDDAKADRDRWPYLGRRGVHDWKRKEATAKGGT